MCTSAWYTGVLAFCPNQNVAAAAGIWSHALGLSKAQRQSHYATTVGIAYCRLLKKVFRARFRFNIRRGSWRMPTKSLRVNIAANSNYKLGNGLIVFFHLSCFGSGTTQHVLKTIFGQVVIANPWKATSFEGALNARTLNRDIHTALSSNYNLYLVLCSWGCAVSALASTVVSSTAVPKLLCISKQIPLALGAEKCQWFSIRLISCNMLQHWSRHNACTLSLHSNGILIALHMLLAGFMREMHKGKSARS